MLVQRLCLIVAALLCGAYSNGSARAANGSVDPYVAYVAREGEFARCGPSEEYYKTDALRAGMEVEVFLETQDGWLGIRPPEGSFCWIQSDQVQITADQTTGTVTDSATVAWIGTQLGKARQYRWQVRLQQGETVAILGSARRAGPEGDELWYRIVPPAGEFRWVHRGQLADSPDQVEYSSLEPTAPPQLASRERPAPNREPRSRTERTDASRTAANSPTRRQAENAAPRGDGASVLEADLELALDDTPVGSGVAHAHRQTSQEREEADRRRASAPRPPREMDALAAEDGHNVLATPLADSEEEAVIAASHDDDWTRSGGGRRASNEPRRLQATDPPALDPIQDPNPVRDMDVASSYQPELNADTADIEGLRLELSRAMAAGARADEVERLRARCQGLSEQAPDSVTRGRAALLLRRIEEYQRIARQRGGTLPAPVDVSRTASPVEAADELPRIPAVPNTVAVAAATGERTQFDRQGWLVKVYSARPDAPPYAITDSAGRTVSYVTPVPGLNLRRYLNQEVGLYGRMAYDTSLETPHLIAEQAVRIRN